MSSTGIFLSRIVYAFWIHLCFVTVLLHFAILTVALDTTEITTTSQHPHHHQQQPLLTPTSTSSATQQHAAGTHPIHIGPPNCTAVIPTLESKGIPLDELPRDALNDTTLRYCDVSQGTCCTNNVETKLATQSRMQLDKTTKESIGKLASVLGTRATKFNDFFKELLAQSKKEFHEMFKKTYGVIYEQNSYVFSDFFTELENYYSRGKVDLAEELDTFFNILYQKMFSVLNAQYTFDDKYLGCVSEHMKELKPFGDVPDKLSVQIKRSFVATRTYEQALAAAAEVTRNMINVRPNAECTSVLMKMQQCRLCGGHVAKPCSNYCVNVMKGCLHYYNELDAEWDNFVASMEKVSERLLGPFNIVMVVEPINIKISEAIMNFQETGHDISQRVFEGCGRPQLGPRKRSINPKFSTIEQTSEQIQRSATAVSDDFNPPVADTFDQDSFTFDESSGGRERRASETSDQYNRELQYEPLKFSNSDDASEEADEKNGSRKNRKKQKQQANVKRRKNDDDNKEPQMDKLVKDIRQRVKDSKKFWSNLPYQICNNEEFSVAPTMEGNCWNGVTVDRYPHSIVTESHSNPEFTNIPSGSRQSSLIAGQLFTLRNAVGHLRNAYNGLDVEWSDGEESYYGSGSGSGAGIDDDDDDLDDTGSGINSYNPRTPIHTDTTSNNNNNNNNHKIAINTGIGTGDTTLAPAIDDHHDDNKSSSSSSASESALRINSMPIIILTIYYLWVFSYRNELVCNLL